MTSGTTLGPRASLRRAAVMALGLAIAGVLAGVDVAGGSGTTVIATVVLAPIVVSLLAGPAETAVVGAVALVLAVASATWNHNLDTGAYYLRVAVVAAGGAMCVLLARSRERTARDRERFALLAAVAEVADGRLTLELTAARLCDLVVPVFADICVCDVLHEGGLRRLAVTATGPDAAERESRLLTRQLPQSDEPGVGAAITSGRSQFLTRFSEAVLGAIAHGPDDLDLLRSLRPRAGIVIPLSARGRTLGALTLLVTDHSRRDYGARDVEFAEVLAGRVALALDNAGLFTELQTMEAQLSAALGSLTEAVTIQNAHGNLIYANTAAATLLGFASPRELLATPAQEIAERFHSFREDGVPLQLHDLPGRQAMTGTDPKPLTVRVVDRKTGEQHWRLTKSSAVRDDNGRTLLIVNVIADTTAAKRAELVQRLLSGAGEALAASADPGQTLQQLADLCVPELADWCSASLPDAQGQLRTVAVAHADPEKVALARRVSAEYPVSMTEPRGAGAVYREQAVVCTNDITDEMLVAAAQDAEHLQALRSLGVHAALIVPMISRGRSVGVLSLVSAESGRSFAEADIVLASELASRAATALENARLYTERSNIAQTLQTSLLPDPLPVMDGWRTASLYRPAGDENQVGGDFYEAIPMSGDWLLVVGDVTGRGAPAAALTGLMRHTLRTAATLTGSAVQALEKLNQDLVNRPQLSLCTAICLELRQTTGEVRADIICAGHPLPILIRAGRAEPVGQFGPLLGAYGDERWEPKTITLQPGDVLVLFSDGLLDATGPEDRFGPQRLQQALTGAAGADDAIGRIERALSEFQVGPQADDTAVLAVELVGVPVLSVPQVSEGPVRTSGQDPDTDDARSA